MIKELLTQSFAAAQQERASHDQAKVGILRGGSCCCRVGDAYFGECPRVAQLRLRGISSAINEESDCVFQLGYAHESNVLSKLLTHEKVKTIVIPELTYSFKVNHPKLVVGNQLQLDINGHSWSGSPDFVVEMEDGWRYGIETKALVSSSSAAKVHDSDAPYTKALLQAAMYSHVAGVPFHIVYGMYFYAGNFKQKINPFYREFKVVFDGNDRNISFVRESGEKVLTDYSIRGILDAYKLIAESQTVLPRPMEKEMFRTYSRCDYCSHKDQCHEYDCGMLSDEQFLEGK